MTDLSHIDTVIWDFDGVFYSYQQTSREMFCTAAAKGALKLGLPLSMEEALAIAYRGAEYNHEAKTFFLEEYDIDPSEYHLTFHEFVDDSFLKPCPNMQACFPQAAHLKHVVMTHSARSWLKRAMRQLDIEKFFPEDTLYCFEDYDYMRKDSGRQPFETVLKKADRPPETALMVEDTAANLLHPYEMGMMTAHIHHGEPLKDKPTHVHLQCENAPDVLRMLERKLKD